MIGGAVRQGSAPDDVAPGDEPAARGILPSIVGYLIGLMLSAGLTIVSFYVAKSVLVWEPSIPIALMVLAIAQIGVHLVFFLHLTSASDSVNNILALAFGLLIVLLLVLGSSWIMTHMNRNMVPMSRTLQAGCSAYVGDCAQGVRKRRWPIHDARGLIAIRSGHRRTSAWARPPRYIKRLPA